MSFRWIGFIAGRLVARKRGSLPVFSIMGIAVGVLALTVIIAVMNGFQLGFIESILEISSYYARVDQAPAGEDGNKLRARLSALPGVTAVVPFREVQALIRGGVSQEAALIRGLKSDTLKTDPVMAAKLAFEEGSFDIAGPSSILLGSELARRLGAGLGDEVTLITIGGSAPLSGVFTLGESGEARNTPFTVTGIFRSGFYEYDLGWAFINFERAGELAGSGYTLGLKLTDRFQDRRLLESVLPLIAAYPEARASSWRDYNRAFFGALRTEKLFMFVLVGLIFIVVGLNIYQAQRRMVLERREEIGLLRAIGAGDRAVRLVFVWDGFIIGFIGAGAGMILALAISFNIGAFFSALEKAVNGVLRLLHGSGEFAVFSPAVFYIKEIEGRVIPREALLIFLFGLFSALGAAWFASGKVSKIHPAEVLRYE
ncbi:MAG: ABC transporter permease [Treponema sp.]|nr:ABC transporter permease [Treponema sp.]